VWGGEGGWKYLTSAVLRYRGPAQRSSRCSSKDNPWRQSYRNVGGPRAGVDVMPLSGIEPRFLDRQARSHVTISALDIKCNAYYVLVRHLNEPRHCFNYAFWHEDVWGCGGITPLWLTSVLDGDKWSVPRSGLFSLNKHWLGGWVGPRASLDAVGKRKISCPWQELNPDRPARSLLPYDWAIQVKMTKSILKEQCMRMWNGVNWLRIGSRSWL
jgi:hypothetical protein